MLLINLNLVFAYFILLLNTLIGEWHILFIIYYFNPNLAEFSLI